jgi:hypothetical protein
MGVAKKTLEVTGTIDAQRRLILDEPLPVRVPTRVRVTITLLEEADIKAKEWLLAADANPAFDFQKDPEEDVYTLADGKPFHYQR